MIRNIVFLCSITLLPAMDVSAAESEIDFVRDVKPILVQRCLRCHSSLEQESNLRLDSVAAIFQGGDSGEVISPGDSGQSLLIQRIVASQDERMPPEGKPLTGDQVATLKSWIDQDEQVLLAQKSVSRTTHWAFQRPEQPPVPDVSDPQWMVNPIDAFVAAGHQQQGLKAEKLAEKHVLLRRVYLDLIGLPPSPIQLQDFLDDQSPRAYEKVVEQLLESPLYGQRWGRHWMDVWRYSDWSGYKKEVRNSQPHIWRWRDWIIDSLNADKGYDRMILEMLAADEIAPDDQDALPATGFLVRNWYKFNRNVWLENAIDHTCKAFLGVSMGCAKCHDHMYDPISQVEYYRFRAFFEPHNVRSDPVADQAGDAKAALVRIYDSKPEAPTYRFIRGDDRKPDKDRVITPALPELFGGEIEIHPVALPKYAVYPGLQPFVQQRETDRAMSALNKARAALNKAATALKKAQGEIAGDDQTVDEAAKAKLSLAELSLTLAQQGLEAAEAKLKSVEALIVADNARYASPPNDNVKQLIAATVEAQQRSALLQATAELARAEQALTAAQTARKQKPKDAKAKQAVAAAQKKVTASRKKHQSATAALKKPPADYTPLGPKYSPTSTGRRKALAEWIASSENPLTARVAVNHIWMRHFGTPLVESVFDFGHNAESPRHRRLLDYLAVELMQSGWKMKSLHRLIVTSRVYRMRSSGGEQSAENVRLDPDNLWLWRMNSRRMEAEIIRDSFLSIAGNLDTSLGGPELDHEQGLTTYRRSVYYCNAYEKQMQFLLTFDLASVEECYRRSESIVPQQALALVNSPLALAQSRVLAGKLSELVGSAADRDQVFIATAYWRILCRKPSQQESQRCQTFLTQQTQRLSDKKDLTLFTSGSESQVKPSADPRQRARENLVQVLMNHNDFVTIR